MVTTDALNTQKNIARKVQEGGGDYVLALKENHWHLYEDVRDYFAWCHKQPHGLARLCEDEAQSQEWGHGRREVRRCFCLQTTPQEWPQALSQWKGLRCVVMIERERIVLPPEGVPSGASLTPTITRHFYLSNLEPEATRLLHAIRTHWGIENSLHWALDVAFAEDECRIRRDHAPQNLTTLRKLALNLLRQDTKAKSGFKARRKAAGRNNDYLLCILVGS